MMQSVTRRRRTMKNIGWIARCALALLGVPTLAGAQLIEPCKNHFILSEKCTLKATDVAIGPPGAVAIDAQGNLYFSSPSIVFKVADGVLTRVAGNGTPGFGGDGGPARDALLSFPEVYFELVMW